MKSVISAIAPFSPADPFAPASEPVGKIQGDGEISPPTALVVDDEPLIRWSVAESLSDLGYSVSQAGDAHSALRELTAAARPFAIVVLDLRLPDMTDLSLLGTVRQLLPEAAVILMTAFGTPEVISGAKALGANVLFKPFELDELKRLAGTPGAGVK